jgi:hypothetical protein
MSNDETDPFLSGPVEIPDINGMSNREVAETLALSGFPVIPLRSGTGKEAREPVVKWKERLDSRYADPARDEWLGDEYGVGLPADRRSVYDPEPEWSLVVIDVDTPEKLPNDLNAVVELYPTAMQQTRADEPGRAHHVYWTTEAYGDSTAKFPSEGWGEVRATGQIAVTPGLGGRFWERRTIVKVPEELAAWLSPANESAPQAATWQVDEFLDAHAGTDDPERLGRMIEDFRKRRKAKGHRNEALIQVAGYAMRDALVGVYPARDAYEALREEVGDYDKFEGVMARAIGYALADDIEKVHSERGVFAPKPAERAFSDVPAVSLEDAHKTFQRWLGDDYDQDALNAVLAAAAVERMDGDPLWLLVISGPGNAKTETVQSLVGAGALITSTISSEGALLSATAKKDVSKDATGGLLRKLGERGLLVIKDVTSIISANRDTRATVLAAMREIYDGHWYREVGVDGGRTLTWAGRIAVIGAVTTAWDTAHAVTSAMGDRFVLIRMDSSSKLTRRAAGRQAMDNVGYEVEMRAML